MGISIRVQEAPLHTIPCHSCEDTLGYMEGAKEGLNPYPDVALDFGWVDGETVPEDRFSDIRCAPWCEGSITIPMDGYEMNVSGTTHSLMSTILGLSQWGGEFGEIPVQDLPTLQRRILKRLNSDLRSYTSPTVESRKEKPSSVVVQEGQHTILPVQQGPKCISFRYDEERVIRTLRSFQTLIGNAVRQNAPVIWS